ncbi:MAG: hypothetical protein SNJ69_06060 [Chloroflexaceae bacterium]
MACTVVSARHPGERLAPGLAAAALAVSLPAVPVADLRRMVVENDALYHL